MLSAIEMEASERALNSEYASYAIMGSLQMISPNSGRRSGERKRVTKLRRQ